MDTTLLLSDPRGGDRDDRKALRKLVSIKYRESRTTTELRVDVQFCLDARRGE